MLRFTQLQNLGLQKGRITFKKMSHEMGLYTYHSGVWYANKIAQFAIGHAINVQFS